VTLQSIAPQAESLAAEVLVITDGPDAASTEVSARHRTKALSLPRPAGLNAARNAAIANAASELIIFVDDDVQAPSGWLEAYLRGAEHARDHDVFGGPINARLEGGGPRGCGREKPPITTLDLGRLDRDVPLVWGANMAIRARAFQRLGGFDETLSGTGDEEEWLRRYRAQGGCIRYLAAAGLDHRRTPADATLMSLARAAYVRGRSARRYDARSGVAPTLGGELRTLAGCAWHVARRRCPVGIVFAAQSAGRSREALSRGAIDRIESPARPPRA
jgi:GT2 family glycosyltransferase